MGAETQESIPKDTRLSLLFSIPSQKFVNLMGDLPPFPIEVENDDWKTTWDQQTIESVSGESLLLTKRYDQIGNKNREVEIGEMQNQNWVSFTVMDTTKALALRFYPQGNINSFSAYLQSTQISGDSTHCAFHYDALGGWGSANITIVPEQEESNEDESEEGDEEEELLIKYLEKRSLEENLKEFSHVYKSLLQEEQDMDEEADDDDDEQDDEETGDESEMLYEGVQQTIDEELRKVLDDSFNPEVIPQIVEELTVQTVMLLSDMPEGAPPKGPEASIFKREEIIQALSEALAVTLATQASVVKQQQETGIELEFTSDSIITYRIFEMNSNGKKRTLSSETKRIGEKFNHFFYTVETRIEGSQTVIDVADIRGTKTNRFVGPSRVNIPQFYDRVSNPFTDGVDALDVVDVRFEEVTL